MVKKNMSFSLKSKDKKKLIIIISVIIGIVLGSLFFCSCKNGWTYKYLLHKNSKQGFTSNQTNESNENNVGSAVGESVGSAVGQSVGSALGEKVGTDIDNKVHSNQTNQSSNKIESRTNNNLLSNSSPKTHSNQQKPNQHSNQVTSNQTSFTISPTKEGFKMNSLFKKNLSLGNNPKKEGFLDKLMKKRKNNSNQKSPNQTFPNQPSLNKEGFSVIQQGPGAGMLSTPLGANINWNTSDGMENMSPYANILQKHKNIKAPDPSSTTEEGVLFLFGGNLSSPSCCGPNIGSSFSTSDGCLCTSDEQIKYLNKRGGNRTLSGDNF